MDSVKQQLQWTHLIQAAPAEVYAALTQTNGWQRWCCDLAQIDPHAGGRLYVCAESYCACGEFTALEENRRLAFTWRGLDEPATAVEITLEAAPSGTQMMMTVTPNDPAAAAWAEKSPDLEKAWQKALENLYSLLETGYEARQRPLLGVQGGQDLNEELVAKLGVPVQQGFLIFDPIPGMGAHAAGMEKNDVIVAIDGQAISGVATLGPVMVKYQPGDVVEVTFYRGADQKTAAMTLSERPRPEVPATVQAMAEKLQEIYAQQAQTFAQVFEGVPESQLTWTPNDIKWSAKHVVAHLLTSERAMHEWLARQLAGLDTDNWASHDEIWVRATADSYPDTATLLAAFQQANAETVQFVLRLPAEFVARKMIYVQMAGLMIDGMRGHTDVHLDQIRAVLAEAKAAETP
ncbi:MAG: SRPBCC domain-containing protein [Anaerolineae bacterium]|nr:SRPBCC domain-containing protein [Anaerolineae bacterium]